MTKNKNLSTYTWYVILPRTKTCQLKLPFFHINHYYTTLYKLNKSGVASKVLSQAQVGS